MDALKIIRTINSLEVSLDAETGTLFFSGRSYPENSVGFFKPILEWVEQYSLTPAAKTQCTFKLEYCNSASRKCIMDIFKILETIHKTKGSVTVIWVSEAGDDSMRETGEEYQNLFRLDFQFRSC